MVTIHDARLKISRSLLIDTSEVLTMDISRVDKRTPQQMLGAKTYKHRALFSKSNAPRENTYANVIICSLQPFGSAVVAGSESMTGGEDSFSIYWYFLWWRMMKRGVFFLANFQVSFKKTRMLTHNELVLVVRILRKPVAGAPGGSAKAYSKKGGDGRVKSDRFGPNDYW